MNVNWLYGRGYIALLIALLLLLVVYPVFRGPVGSPLLAKVLFSAVFLGGGWVVFAHRRLRPLAVVFGVPAIVGAWSGYVLPNEDVPFTISFFHLSAVSFQVLVLTVVLREVYREKTVTVNAIAAALCGYLLLGIAFGHVYCVIEVTVPGSFRGLDAETTGHNTHFQLTYFSFITLTTIGYGDITPGADTARSFAMVEGVTGQFYMAVLVAELIGKRVAQALAPTNELGSHQ